MPRSRSSGALSIESNERNTIFGLCFCNTFVIAAVSVVFPWSMCPIVPTFTCGLLRSNFSFAMIASKSLELRVILRPQCRRDLFDLRQVELANLALIARRHRVVLLLGRQARGSEAAVRRFQNLRLQDRFPLARPQSLALHFPQKRLGGS